jgi:hypothetical protein
MWRRALVLITLVAFALRTHALGAVTLRWDEGWSIALGTLPAGEIVRLTALDVHPPLYYFLLRPWLALGGSHEFWVRMFSVLAGTIAVPLVAAATTAWWRPAGRAARLAALVAATLTALAPALVYYSGVARMYALTTPWLLLAVWGVASLSRSTMRPWVIGGAAAVIGTAGAIYTFYYAAFAVVGLFAAALLVWPRAWRRLLAVALITALAYMPWLAYAAPRMLARVGERTGGGQWSLGPVPGLMRDGLCGALLCDPVGWPAIAVTLAVLAIGAALARPRLVRRMGLPVLPTLIVLIGAALGSQAHMFAARYLIVATPFLILGLGWALVGLWRRGRWLGAVSALALALVTMPILTGYVYDKTAEVTGAYDPATDWRQLGPHVSRGDLVAFNILSLAGAYERYRTPSDPPWTYAQLWDPVHEPLADAQARLLTSVQEHDRLWLVLYRGIASADSADLKAWADRTFFPTDGWWHEGTLYQGYVHAGTDQQVSPQADFGHGVRLVDAAYTSQVKPDASGAAAAVALTWQADQVPDVNARVFVHLYDRTGKLVAQHDSFPVDDTRPPKTWHAGETVTDRHGLWIPAGTSGPLDLVVGLYDPTTGVRWTLPDGSDKVRLGSVNMDGSH